MNGISAKKERMGRNCAKIVRKNCAKLSAEEVQV